MIFPLLVALGLPRLNYTWPSPVLERKESIVQPFHDYRRENGQLPNQSLKAIEREVVLVLSHRGITDKNAIATVLGNIQQESSFRVDAWNESEGSYGLMQWRLGRLRRLKAYCRTLTDARCQLFFMISEQDWRNVEHLLKTPGQSIEFYNDAMKKYLRWGIEGSRREYARDYLKILSE